MKNVLLVVDTRNIFVCLVKSFESGKLDYVNFCNSVVGEDHLHHSIAYGTQSAGMSHTFITFLSKLGFVCKFKEPTQTRKGPDDEVKNYWTSPNVQMALDVAKLVLGGKIDKVIIGSSDPELVDLVKWIREQGIVCDICASRIPRVLKNVASNTIEISEELVLKNVEQ